MLPVDSYAGGPEHVIRHHLYARFITQALHDLGLVPFAEPFPHLRLHGMLTKDGAKMSKSRGNVVNPDSYIADRGADATRMYLLFIGPWAEELWSKMGGEYSVHQQPWPAHDSRSLLADQLTLVIQVDGKTRDRIQVPAGIGREQALERAMGRENVRRHLVGGEPRRVVFVPDRLINLVTDSR